jgi:hypothetical protein
MTETLFGEWQRMGSAPRDGTRVLVMIRENEQGPSEVDVVRWVKAANSSEEGWISTDGDSDCVIRYADAELAFWMPLPSPLPKLRSSYSASALPMPPQLKDEAGGSGI